METIPLEVVVVVVQAWPATTVAVPIPPGVLAKAATVDPAVSVDLL